MRRVLTALLLVALAGCSGATGDVGATGVTGVTGAAASGSPAITVDPADPVDVYAAAIERYLTGRENSFPDRVFPVVFVLDRLDPAAADPSTPAGGGGATTPLTPAQQRRIDALVGAALTFVPDPDAATVDAPGGSCRVVRDDGVLLTIGPARATGADTAEVAVHGFVACLGATWFTYVLRRDTAGWAVTGTTGPMAVS